MKPSWAPIILLMAAILACSAGCSKDDVEYKPVAALNLDSLSFEESMKGWELYSWPNGDDWNYSLLPGTNRLKSYEEVTKNYIIVHGTDSLKMLLVKLPENEQVFWVSEDWLERIWGGDYGNLRLPDKKTIDEIRAFCTLINLNLSVGK